MDYSAAKFWLEVAILASNVVLWAWALNSRKHTATNERLDKLGAQITQRIERTEADIEQRLDRHSTQLQALETHRETAPNNGDLKRLHERIDEVTGAIHGLTGEFSGVRSVVNLLHEYLLNKKP